MQRYVKRRNEFMWRCLEAPEMHTSAIVSQVNIEFDSIGEYTVYCDMETAGGWTMLGHYRQPARENAG